MDIYINGCFDIFHAGHKKLLKEAKKLACGAKVIIGLNTDSSMDAIKSGRVNNYSDRRMKLLMEAWLLDMKIQVWPIDREKDIIFHLNMFEEVTMVKGKDYYNSPITGISESHVSLYLVGLKLDEEGNKISSTNLREKKKNGVE